MKQIKIKQIDFLGKDTIEMQTNVLKPGAKILLVDDVLATGGQFYYDLLFSYTSRMVSFLLF